jgi:hypothetical protein
MGAKSTPTKVHGYKKDTPKDYQSHEGKVRGYVPKGSPFAEHPKKKK